MKRKILNIDGFQTVLPVDKAHNGERDKQAGVDTSFPMFPIQSELDTLDFSITISKKKSD